jgi:hypothetical protein
VDNVFRLSAVGNQLEQVGSLPLRQINDICQLLIASTVTRLVKDECSISGISESVFIHLNQYNIPFLKGKTMYLSCISRLFLAVVVISLVGGAVAQTAPPTTSNPCPSTTPPTLASFAVERVIDPTQVLSTVAPTIPASVATGVQNKVLEIHETMAYDSQRQLVTLNLFPMQTGSPVPTPSGGVLPGSVFSTLAMKVDTINTTCTPNLSVMFVGSIAANSSVSSFGNISGAPAMIFVSLTNDNPPAVKNVVELQGGFAVIYSPTGGGTVTFTLTPVTPPGSTGSGPTVAITANSLTTISTVDLDASGTTGSNMPLTFHWTVVAGAADIAGASSAKAKGYLLGGVGTYTFRVTVTDSKGVVSTKDVTFNYL